jgi:uncharacterized membrane protein
MEKDQSKNFLGYDADTMTSAKPKSKYFVYIALFLMLITGIMGKPIALNNSDWYIVILPEIFGFLAGGALLAMFLGYIARIVTKGSSEKGNKFDYFAITFLVVSVIAFISKLFG